MFSGCSVLYSSSAGGQGQQFLSIALWQLQHALVLVLSAQKKKKLENILFLEISGKGVSMVQAYCCLFYAWV